MLLDWQPLMVSFLPEILCISKKYALFVNFSFFEVRVFAVSFAFVFGSM